MSVVNKMLQDLEGRQEAQNISADYVPPNSNRAKQLVLSLIIIGLAASTLTLGIQQFTLNSEERKPQNLNTEKPNDALEYEPKQGDLLAGEMTSKPTEFKQAEISSKPQVTTNLLYQRELTHHTNDDPHSTNKTVNLTNATATASLENRLEIKASSGISHQVSDMRARAHMALENQQPQKAISILQALINVDAKDVKTRKQLASLLFSEKRVADAFNTLQVGLNDFPEDSSMRLMQARIAFKQGDKNLAMKVLKAHPNAGIASADFMSFRAALAEKNGEYKQAYSDYSVLVGREPQNAKWWLGLAVSQDKLLMQDEAVSSYLQVRELNQLPHQVHSFVEERLQLLTRAS